MRNLIWILFLMPMAVLSQSDFQEAENLFRQGKMQQSQVIFESFLKENPNNTKAIEYLGDIQGNLKNWDKSIFYYEKLKKIKPVEANYHYKYGGALGMKAKECNKFKALSLIGDVKLAFEKAISLNPQHIDARWALIELYIQLPGIVGGSERKAIKYSDELLKISTIDGYLSKGRIAEYFNKYKDAEKYYKKAVEISGSKTTYQKLADLYKNKMKQPEKAKNVLEDYNNKKDNLK